MFVGRPALPPESRVRHWYDLGAAFGRYRLLCDERDGHGPWPDFRPVLQSAGQLKDEDRILVLDLDALLRAGARAGPSHPRDVLQEALSGAYDLAYLADIGEHGDAYVMRVLLIKLEDSINEALRVARAAPTPEPSGPPAPHWDRQTGELRLGARVVARYRGIASNVITVLDAFEAAKWAERINYPWEHPIDPDLLHNTIKSLNKRLSKGTLHFRADGKGHGFVWELAQRTV